MKKISVIFFSFISLLHSTPNQETKTLLPIYHELSSLTNPTEQDWFILQKNLEERKDSNSQIEKDPKNGLNKRVLNFKLIGKKPSEKPSSGEVFVNCDKDFRKQCIILYSSFNRNYPAGLKKLVDRLENSTYQGHILWKLGGWPDLEGGSLKLAHVPYAFKPCFFKEAQKKGYEKVLWLDCSMIPVDTVQHTFDIIDKKGYICFEESHFIGPYMNEEVANEFGLSLEETHKIKSCLGGNIGINFSHEKGVEFFEKWHEAAQSPVAFFSPRHDQNAIAIIIYQLGLEMEPFSRIALDQSEVTKESLFILDRRQNSRHPWIRSTKLFLKKTKETISSYLRW